MSGPPRPAPIAPIMPIALIPGDRYVAGACNIGPWEIRRRRAFGVAGFVAAGLLFAVLVASGAPAWTRLLLLLPLWGGAFSWLQARRRFCAAFAMAGIANFGDGDGSRRSVTDVAAHELDMRATVRLTRDSFVIAIVPTVVAVLIPV